MIDIYPQIVEGMSDFEYHSDPCDTPSLSPSMAKVISEHSAAHAEDKHPRLGGAPHWPNDNMIAGTIFHTLMLGTGSEIIEVEADAWRKKADKAIKNTAIRAGQSPILSHKLPEIKDAARIAKRKLKDRYGIELHGRRELALFWEHPMPDGGFACRTKLDCLDDGAWYDLKFTDSANPKRCRKQIIDKGYHIQWAAHCEALRENGIDADRMEFLLLFCENKRPNCVLPVRLSNGMKELGEREWNAACELWYKGIATGEWQEYWNGIYTACPKPWEMKGDMEELDDE